MDFETMFMRVWWPASVVTLFGAGLPAAALMSVWAPLGFVFWPLAVVVFTLSARVILRHGVTSYRCSECQSRVRDHARRCHRCGSSVVWG